MWSNRPCLSTKLYIALFLSILSLFFRLSFIFSLLSLLHFVSSLFIFLIIFIFLNTLCLLSFSYHFLTLYLLSVALTFRGSVFKGLEGVQNNILKPSLKKRELHLQTNKNFLIHNTTTFSYINDIFLFFV